MSVSAGNTQRVGGSEQSVGGRPVSEADIGVEGNDCFLSIVQFKVRSQNVRSCKPPGTGRRNCLGVSHSNSRTNTNIRDCNGGGAEGRHAVREDSGGEGLYGHTDCSILRGGVVHDLHTGVVNCARGGGGGNHEGNPTSDSGDRSGIGGQDITLEAAALLKSQLGNRGRGLEPAVGRRRA